MITPIATLHGSGRENLSFDLSEAHRAVSVAFELTKRAHPHPRDYADIEHWRLASREADERLKKLQDVRNDLFELLQHVMSESVE